MTSSVSLNPADNTTTTRSMYGSGVTRVRVYSDTNSVEDSNSVLFGLSGILGSTGRTVGSDGSDSGIVRYTPYGTVRTGNTADLGVDQTFTGQTNDPGTGLIDYNARQYDPVLAKFIQPDTIVPDMANPQDLNRYTYVRGNPVNATDPSGHDYCGEGKGGGCGGVRQDDTDGNGLVCAQMPCENPRFGQSPYGDNEDPRDADWESQRMNLSAEQVGDIVSNLVEGSENYSDKVTVVVTQQGGNRYMGRYTITQYHYVEGLDDGRKLFGKAENLVLSTRWLGRAFLVYDVAITASEEWGTTAGKSKAYRVTRTAAVTTGTVAATASGSVIGARTLGSFACKGGLALCAGGATARRTRRGCDRRDFRSRGVWRHA